VRYLNGIAAYRKICYSSSLQFNVALNALGVIWVRKTLNG